VPITEDDLALGLFSPGPLGPLAIQREIRQYRLAGAVYAALLTDNTSDAYLASAPIAASEYAGPRGIRRLLQVRRMPRGWEKIRILTAKGARERTRRIAQLRVALLPPVNRLQLLLLLMVLLLLVFPSG